MVRVAAFLVVAAVTSTACTAALDGPTETTGATAPPPAGLATEESGDVSSEPRDESDPFLALPADDYRSLADDITLELLRLDPELVTELGAANLVGTRNDRLTSRSAEAQHERAASAAAALGRLDVAATGLSPAEEISATALRWYLHDVVTLSRFPHHDYPVNFITGIHTNFPEFMADVHPIASVADAEDYLARLRAIGPELGEVGVELQRRERNGYLPTDIGLRIAASQLEGTIGTGLSADHPLVADFASRLDGLHTLSAEEKNALISRATDIVTNEVLPAYRILLGVVEEADRRSDEHPGVWAFPDGAAYYDVVLEHHLGLETSAEEIHALGVEQVARVRAELASELATMGYDPDEHGLSTVVALARADAPSRSLASEGDRTAALEAGKRLVEEAEKRFAADFSRYPYADLAVIRPRPEREADFGAYYRPPPLDGSRPGLYYLSLAASTMPLFTFATTTYHEAVPGHHFQLALQREHAGLPLHQRVLTFTGFAEGWALYAERLAYEAGLYDDDPYGNLGRLLMELLRAARMVVDTGIHHDRWSRDEAIDYLLSLGFESAQAAGEVDRYIVWPGQAPSYLVGMLEILRLREQARTELGDRFDLRTFHDAILGAGSVPLDLLDDIVSDYIERVR